MKTKNKIIFTAIVIAVLALLYTAYSGRFSTKPAFDPDEAVVGESRPPLEWVPIFFTPSYEAAQGGNFTFQYPSVLSIKEDSLKKAASGREYHLVILAGREGVDIKDTIEINAPDKSCGDYGVCKEIGGIATNTNSTVEIPTVVVGPTSTDAELLGWFDEIVKSFKVFPPPPAGLGPLPNY